MPFVKLRTWLRLLKMLPPKIWDRPYQSFPKSGDFDVSTCEEPIVFPGEGHTLVYWRYAEIVQAMLAAWE